MMFSTCANSAPSPCLDTSMNQMRQGRLGRSRYRLHTRMDTATAPSSSCTTSANRPSMSLHCGWSDAILGSVDPFLRTCGHTLSKHASEGATRWSRDAHFKLQARAALTHAAQARAWHNIHVCVFIWNMVELLLRWSRNPRECSGVWTPHHLVACIPPSFT